MTRPTVVFLLLALVAQVLFAAPVAAGSNETKIKKNAAKVKAALAKLGVGEEARAEVKLFDKTKISGYVRDTGDDSFVIVDEVTGEAATVPYSHVKQIRGHNLTTGAKIAIWLGITAGVLLLLHLLFGRD